MLLTLSLEIKEKIFRNFSYQELCQLRGVCKKLKKMVEKRLNKAYSKLRKDVESVMMDKFFEVMPRQESKHRDHPLNELHSLTSIMKRRLDSLGFKFDDPVQEGHCCFYAGKMLDVMVPMLHWIDSYLPSVEEIAENNRASILNLLPTPPDQFNAYEMAVPFTDLDYLLEHQFLKYTIVDIKRHKEQVLNNWKSQESAYKPQSVTDSSSPNPSPTASKSSCTTSELHPAPSSTSSSSSSSLTALDDHKDDHIKNFWHSNEASKNILLKLAENMKMSKESCFCNSLKKSLNRSFVILNLEKPFGGRREDKEQVHHLLELLGLPTKAVYTAKISRVHWSRMRISPRFSHSAPGTPTISSPTIPSPTMSCSSGTSEQFPEPPMLVKVTLNCEKSLETLVKTLKVLEKKSKNLYEFKIVVMTMKDFVQYCVD